MRDGVRVSAPAAPPDTEPSAGITRDYDAQLLESVGVRRRRLRDALLFGTARARRGLDEGWGKLFGGVALAAVLCAGCVGWSFLKDRLDKGGFGSRPTSVRSAVVAPGLVLPSGHHSPVQVPTARSASPSHAVTPGSST